MATKVVFMTVYPGEQLWDIISGSAPSDFAVTAIASQASDTEKIEALSEAEFVLGFGPTVAEDVLKSAPNLKLIQLASAGYDTLDVDLLRRMKIPLATSSGLNASVVAEHTVALILAVYRKLPRATARVAEGGWLLDSPATDPFTYRDLRDKRVGIVGFGNIGRQVAKRLRGFECSMQVSNRSPVTLQQEQALGVRQVDLEELLTTSDVVSLHVPLAPETTHLIGATQLAQMKSSAILINTSRGAVVDEPALIEALQDGQILAAGLDVTEQEPAAPDNPLRTMENVVLTPHVGGSLDSMERVLAFCWQNIRAVLEGREPHNVVT